MTLNLLTETGVLLGVLLLAGPDELEAGARQRDCTFERLFGSEFIGHELADVIAFAEGKTYRCNVRAIPGQTSILALIHEGMSVTVALRAGGACQWHVGKLFGRSASTGRCERAT